MPATGRRRPRRPVTFQAVAQGRAFLAEKGLDLSGEQQTKTKTALQYYARSR